VRPLKIFGIGFVALILAFSVTLWAKWALFVAAGIPLLFLVAGQFFFPRAKRSLQLWMNPEIIEYHGDVRLRLSGREITLAFFKKWYEFRIEVRNLWLLMTVGLLSLGALAAVSTMPDLAPSDYGLLFFAYLAVSAWLPVCYLAWRWIWERRAMQTSGISLGSFRVGREEKPMMRRVIYQFNDQRGGHRAGSFLTFFCDSRDDLTVVFYDESNPEISVPASAMMFHKLKWGKSRAHDS
jgi:hypothetical protein